MSFAEYTEGTRILDCGDRGEIVDVAEDDEPIYTVKFEDGETVVYPASEIEIGIVDGTIRVRPPEVSG